MAVKRYSFNVALVNPENPDDVIERVVEVRAVDRLKAELEAGRQKLPEAQKAPQNHTALWLWCSMVRTGDTTVSFQEWKNEHLVEFDKRAEIEPDPTTAGPSGSPSSSPPTSEADPTTGSESTTTDS